MIRKTGLLGGAFNPPHYGHLRPAQEAMQALGLERVVFIPTGVHPFKGPELLAPVEHRLAMLRLALTGWPGFDLWEIEAQSSEISYTVNTLTAWHCLHPDQEPVLLIGADILRELHLWRAWRRIPELAHVVLMTRPGFVGEVDFPAWEYLERFRVGSVEELDRQRLGRYGFLPIRVTPQPIASTELRHRLRTGEAVAGMMPEGVAGYIGNQKLFQ
ncbi:MAG: nicotinate (nicotinamide) nucleotide adenylyltransferase [Magnetococcales bacterium]|nr:nicotinate (nicotinamide) nucleotide adenylyltransferase [Magnetococcales bacterium]